MHGYSLKENSVACPPVEPGELSRSANWAAPVEEDSLYGLLFRRPSQFRKADHSKFQKTVDKRLTLNSKTVCGNRQRLLQEPCQTRKTGPLQKHSRKEIPALCKVLTARI